MKFSIMNFSSERPMEEEPKMESVMSESDNKRASKDELRDAWLGEPMIKHGIELHTDLMMKGLTIKSDDKTINDDLKVIEFHSPFSRVIEMLCRDTSIFGTSFTEYLYYSKGKQKKITGLWNLDPVRFDFMRNENGSIMITPSGKPTSYFETVDSPEQAGGKELVMGADYKYGIKHGRDTVTHFSFETMPGTIEGISRIQAAYRTVKDKWDAETGMKEAIKRFGVPIIDVSVGDDRHNVNRNSLKNAKEEMIKIAKKSVIVHPNWQQISLLQPKSVADISKNLSYYSDIIPVALGIPKALLLESGDATNRATLRQQIRLYITRLEKEREKLKKYLLNDLFRTMKDVNGWNKLPEIKFDPITLEDVESFANRIKTYLDAGVLQPFEIKDDVLRVEKFVE